MYEKTDRQTANFRTGTPRARFKNAVEQYPLDMSRRYAEIDWIKAVGIIAVILIHCIRPIWDPQASFAERVLNHELRFAVPGFVFCSGFLYAHTRAFDWKITLRRFYRIALPYLVASIAAETYRAIQWGPQGAREIMVDLLTASAFGHYYYVFVIITLVLATPLIASLPTRVIAALTGLLMLLQFYMTAAPAIEPASGAGSGSDFWMFRSPLLWWNYFFLGWLARIRAPWLESRVVEHRGAITLGLALACTFSTASHFVDLPAPVPAVASWLQVFFVVALIGALACGREHAHPSVARLSDATYAIYLFHLFFLLAVQPYFQHARGALDVSVVLAQFASALAGSLVLVVLTKRVLGKRSRFLIGA